MILRCFVVAVYCLDLLIVLGTCIRSGWVLVFICIFCLGLVWLLLVWLVCRITLTYVFGLWVL